MVIPTSSLGNDCLFEKSKALFEIHYTRFVMVIDSSVSLFTQVRKEPCSGMMIREFRVPGRNFEGNVFCFESQALFISNQGLSAFRFLLGAGVSLIRILGRSAFSLSLSPTGIQNYHLG